MKKCIFTLLTIAVFASVAMAQASAGTPTSTGTAGTVAPGVDILGAHNNYGRGCAGCHAPHSGARGAGNNSTTDPYAGANALFAQDMGPLYGQTFDFSDLTNSYTANTGKYVFIAPSGLVGATAQGYSDIRGIVMCLACHDGAVARGAMMQNYAYEQQIGALPSTYGSGHIPTLLGADGSSSGYHNDHPVGENATVSAALGASNFGNNAAPGSGNGLQYTITGSAPSQGISAIASAGSYTTFMSSYGAPALMKGGYSFPTPVNASGVPYLVCTTCHNQHIMNVYAASANSKIAGSATGTYATYFFINGPYNINDVTPHPTSANSTTQFCRQCHFGESNEANGGSLPTTF